MNLTMSIALYFLIWWTLLFAILPIGMRTQGDEGKVVPGTPASAPVKPRFLWIVGVNTVLSLVVLFLARAAIINGWIPLGIADVVQR